MVSVVIQYLCDHLPTTFVYTCLSYIPCRDITTDVLQRHMYRLRAWNIYRKSDMYPLICSKKFHDFLWNTYEPSINNEQELYFEYMDIDCIFTLFIESGQFIITFW